VNKKREKMSSSRISGNPLQILQSLSDATVEVVEKLAPSIVRVGAGGYRFGGSGIVWSKDGRIVTANHVVERFTEVEVGLPKEGKSLEGRVVGRDAYSDIALVKVEAGDLKPIELGDSESVKVGQFVLAFANPLGNQQPSVTSGIVTSARRSFGGGWGWRMMEDVVVTDAPLNPGYSGGPLVDAWGRMVGLNSAFVSSRGIAIQVNKVKTIAERLARDGRIKRGYLGIVSNEISLPEDLSSSANQGDGIILVSVEPGSPAKKAGLVIGDIILKFGQNPVTSTYDLHKLLTEEVIGKPTKVSVLRAEKLMDLTITPGEARS
jgi:S1-C subfamily serine protease